MIMEILYLCPIVSIMLFVFVNFARMRFELKLLTSYKEYLQKICVVGFLYHFSSLLLDLSSSYFFPYYFLFLIVSILYVFTLFKIDTRDVSKSFNKFSFVVFHLIFFVFIVLFFQILTPESVLKHVSNEILIFISENDSFVKFLREVEDIYM